MPRDIASAVAVAPRQPHGSNSAGTVSADFTAHLCGQQGDAAPRASRPHARASAREGPATARDGDGWESDLYRVSRCAFPCDLGYRPEGRLWPLWHAYPWVLDAMFPLGKGADGSKAFDLPPGGHGEKLGRNSGGRWIHPGGRRTCARLRSRCRFDRRRHRPGHLARSPGTRLGRASAPPSGDALFQLAPARRANRANASVPHHCHVLQRHGAPAAGRWDGCGGRFVRARRLNPVARGRYDECTVSRRSSGDVLAAFRRHGRHDDQQEVAHSCSNPSFSRCARTDPSSRSIVPPGRRRPFGLGGQQILRDLDISLGWCHRAGPAVWPSACRTAREMPEGQGQSPWPSFHLRHQPVLQQLSPPGGPKNDRMSHTTRAMGRTTNRRNFSARW